MSNPVRNEVSPVGKNAKKIGLISDTHGLLRPEALRALQGSDLLIHAGDVGRAEVLFFSLDEDTHFWQVWKWPWAVRWDRLFTKIK